MTQEDKRLLLKDLCARLPYGVKIRINHHHAEVVYSISSSYINDCPVHLIEPYLRPMSSMTEEEKVDYVATVKFGTCIPELPIQPRADAVDWLNKHHFDYRGLIEKDLALPAPEGMYKVE